VGNKELSVTWHRSDYILRGEYCPLQVFQAHVDLVRACLGADFLIHVALDHEVVLRSLCWACGTPGGSSEALSQRLRSAHYRDVNAKANQALVEIAVQNTSKSISVLNPSTADDLALLLVQIRLRGARVSQAKEISLPNLGWGGLVLNHTGRDGLRPRDGEARSVLLFHPNKKSNKEAQGRLRVPLKDLGVMLKCTFEANTRRDAVVMNQVAERLSSSSSGLTEFPAVAADALRLACEITGSSAGAIYVISPGEKITLKRIAVYSADKDDYPAEMHFNANTTVGRAVYRHRAYQDVGVGGVTAPLDRVVRAEGGTELATPIAGPLANTLEPAIGAIVLYHAQGSQGYGAYERALVRNVSLRLALMHTSMATQDIATAISTLRSESPSRLQISSEKDKIAEFKGAKWPRDIHLAIRKLNTPLQQLAESTQSHSVSLRIAVSYKSELTHGLALARVAAYPAARIEESFALQKEGDPGPHWHVMRTGAQVYVRNTSRENKYRIGRPGTLSALCVPVRIEGVVAGTLNLESPLADNYTAFMPIVMALSGALGRTLADARAVLENRVLDAAAHALTRRHEFSHDLTAVREGVEQLLTSEPKDEILNRLKVMESTIQDLREPESSDTVSASLWKTFQSCVAQAHLRFGIMTGPREEIFHRALDAHATQSLTAIFRSVLHNISYHSDLSAYDNQGQPVPRVTFHSTDLQGTDQAVIVLENQSLQILDEDEVREFYRYPVPGPGGELRLGTYIAGLNARRLGARIHACIAGDPHIIRTTIIVPVGAMG
jgi:GAF domain-containing protein